MPNSRFVHLVRHPYEIITSGMKRGWYGDVYPEFGGHIRPRVDDFISQQWLDLSREDKIAWLWGRTNQVIENLKNKISHDRVFFIRSSDMFSDSSRVSELLRFMNAEDLADNISAIRKQQSKIVNKQGDGYYPMHHNWDDDLKKKVRKILKNYDTYGFDLD